MAKNIAVVGSGMAGLCCAMFAVAQEHTANVTVFSDKDFTDSISYHSGGGMMATVPYDWKGMSMVSVNWGTTDKSWLIAFTMELLMKGESNKALQNAMSEESVKLLRQLGLQINYVKCGEETTTSRWYNIEDTMTHMIASLKLNGVQFDRRFISDETDEVLKEFDHVFMCRGASDASVFGDKTELSAGISQDVIVNHTTKSIDTKVKCFEYSDGRFISPFPSMIRYTSGAHIGDMVAPDPYVLKTGLNGEKLPFTGTRLLSIDGFPFYLRKERVTYVNGGSFVGMHTYPFVSHLAVKHALTDVKPTVFGFDAEFKRVVNKRVSNVNVFSFGFVLFLFICYSIWHMMTNE